MPNQMDPSQLQAILNVLNRIANALEALNNTVRTK